MKANRKRTSKKTTELRIIFDELTAHDGKESWQYQGQAVLTMAGHVLKPLLMLPSPHPVVNKQAVFTNLSGDPTGCATRTS